jgi:hypothetical protein
VKISKDIFDFENAFALYEDVIRKGIHVDVLVNDARQGQYGELLTRICAVS